jgi:hypothetical protein
MPPENPSQGGTAAPLQFEIIARGKGTAVVRLAGRRAPVLVLHRDVVTQFQQAAEAAVLRLRSGESSADATQALVNSFNAIVDQFVIESERFAESLFEVHKHDGEAAGQEFDQEIAALKALRDDGDTRSKTPVASPHFEIRHNDEFVARAEARDGRTIHANVIVSHVGAGLSASEVRAADAPHGIFNRLLDPGDRVAITFAESAEMPQRPDRQARKRDSPPTVHRAPTLKISTARTPELEAYLGADAHLQAVVDYVEGTCVLKVDSVTVHEDGHTTGTRWLRQHLLPSDWVEITYLGRMDRETERNLQVVELEVLDALNHLRKLRGLTPLDAVPEAPFCSFCGAGKSDVGALVEGVHAVICDRCATEVQRLMRKPPE